MYGIMDRVKRQRAPRHGAEPNNAKSPGGSVAHHEPSDVEQPYRLRAEKPSGGVELRREIT